MISRSVRRLSVLAAVATLALAGCGGSGTGAASGGDSTGGASASKSPSGGASSDDRAVEIEVEIEHGQVTPDGKRIDVKMGQPIRFDVDSDAEDELHVHSVPDHEFEVKAADNQHFQFTLNKPGVVEVELHHLGDVVATLAARP